MKPELTQARSCKRCGKALPIHLRADAMYCPAQKGEKRCCKVTKGSLLKQLEPWELKSIHEREVIQRHLPEGAVGYRISVVLDDSLYIFPKVGAACHYNAYGQRVQGGFFTLIELARIPVSALYKIEYVGANGDVLEGGACFLELSRTPRARLGARPNPTARRVSAAVLAGEQVTGSIRLSELASHFGISTAELFPVIARCGLKVRQHARAGITREECGVVAAELQRVNRGVQSVSSAAPSGAQESSPQQATASEQAVFKPSPMVVLTTPALVADELRIVGRKLTRAQEDEAASMSENVRILDESMYRARVVEEQVDKLTGVGFGGSRAKDG